jgi:hypothetical protein
VSVEATFPAPAADRGARVANLHIAVDDEQVSWRLEIAHPKLRIGPAAGHDKLNLSPRRKATIDLLVNLVRHREDLKRIERLEEEFHRDLLRVVGHELFDLLFACSTELREQLVRQLDALHGLDGLDGSQIDLFRIELTFAYDENSQLASWLASLPWEYVRTPVGDAQFNRSGRFLAEEAELILTRRLPVKSKPLGDASRPIRLLFVCSSPDPAHPDSDPELAPVDPDPLLAKLKALDQKQLIVLRELVDKPPTDPAEKAGYTWRVTERALREEVRRFDPVIVHFLGHGRSFAGRGELAFAHENGAVHWVADSSFSGLVQQGRRLRLAFLQACESGFPDPYVSFSGVAQQLAGAGLPAVVAMQYQVCSDTANVFAGTFYDALLDGVHVDHAVEKGRQRILEERHDGRLAFGLPVIYLSVPASLIETTAMLLSPALEKGDAAPGIGCPRCEQELAASDNVCRRCGLRLVCPCGEPYPSPNEDDFCRRCGEPVKRTPYKPDSAAAPLGDASPEKTGPMKAALRALGEPEPEP